MKIYNPKPIDLVRLQIRQKDNVTEYLTLCESTGIEVVEFIKELLNNNKSMLDIFDKKRTSIDIRNCIGGKNGKSISISVLGFKPIEVKELIESAL